MPKVTPDHLAGRRREILAAAAACFARDGFHRTSVQDIVRESGLSAGLIYRYFTGKDDMIAAIVTEWHEDRAAAIATTQDILAGYLELLRSLGTEEAAKDRNLGLQAWAETVRDPRLRDLARDGVDGPRAALGATMPDARARVLIAIYQGLLCQTAWDDDVDVEAFVASVRELVQG
jgi:TetR/AcrR family transcriptional regulator, transcriptional repressor of aconitase